MRKKTSRFGVLRVASIFLIVIGTSPAPSMATPQPARFRDYGPAPKADEYKGPLFVLSQDYPKVKPSLYHTRQLNFLNIPFDQGENWKHYLLSVRDYVLRGNIKADFRAERNSWRRWYHMPWLDYGVNGREAIRGFTKEASIAPGQLHPFQTNKYQSYATAMYNEIAAYTIGQVWKGEAPDITATSRAHGGGFPVGSVMFKMVFTDAPVEEVPYLAPAIEWQAYVNPDANTSDKHVVKTMRLVQLDIAVRDARAEKDGGTGWVYGSYVYDGKFTNTPSYYNLVPMGLSWGNDPTVDFPAEANPTPTHTEINPLLKQTRINPSPDLPAQHLGWGGRLNGPADNPYSSCISCHSTAQWPNKSAMRPNAANVTENSPEWWLWFRNIFCGDTFDEGTVSLDYTLQLQTSVHNHALAHPKPAN